MTFDQKVQEHKELSKKIEELEAQKKALSQEILTLMPKDIKTVITGDYQVRRYSRIFVKTTLAEARTFDAVKLEEVVDKEKLKRLHQLGKPIPNISQFEYITVTKHQVMTQA